MYIISNSVPEIARLQTWGLYSRSGGTHTVSVYSKNSLYDGDYYLAQGKVQESLKSISRLICFNNLEEAQQYLKEHLYKQFLRETLDAPFIYHADIAETRRVVENVQQLRREDIISVHCATMLDIPCKSHLLHKKLKDINLRPVQQSKYEAIAKKASQETAGWKAICTTMLNKYEVWYRRRTHRHFATQIRNALNSGKSNVEMDALLSEIQQLIPVRSWHNDFYGMLTAMRTMLNMGFNFKHEVRDSLNVGSFPSGLTDIVMDYVDIKPSEEKTPMVASPVSLSTSSLSFVNNMSISNLSSETKSLESTPLLLSESKRLGKL